MMVIVAGAVMTALLDLSTKDGNWTRGLISFLILAKSISKIQSASLYGKKYT